MERREGEAEGPPGGPESARRALWDVIRANPGITSGELAALFPFAFGSLYYHLNLLEEKGYIVSQKRGKARYYYPKGAFIPEDMEVRLEDVRLSVAVFIAEHPGVNIRDIEKCIFLAESTARYHVKKLIEQELVRSYKPKAFVDLKPTEKLLRRLKE